MAFLENLGTIQPLTAHVIRILMLWAKKVRKAKFPQEPSRFFATIAYMLGETVRKEPRNAFTTQIKQLMVDHPHTNENEAKEAMSAAQM